jgi:hypothetical protein
MTLNTILAAIAVSEIERAVAWYQQLLGQPPTARPMPTLAEWHVAGGHLQLVHDLTNRPRWCGAVLAGIGLVTWHG